MQRAVSSFEADQETRVERDRTLATLFRPNEVVWQVEESYNPEEHTWRTDLVRMGKSGSWMRQRYTYDIQTHVVYFFGERPVSDEELISLRKNAKMLR